MTRRLVVTMCAVVGALGVGTLPAVADTATHGKDWACIGIDHVDYGTCLQNPLPRQLPPPAN